MAADPIACSGECLEVHAPRWSRRLGGLPGLCASGGSGAGAVGNVNGTDARVVVADLAARAEGLVDYLLSGTAYALEACADAAAAYAAQDAAARGLLACHPKTGGAAGAGGPPPFPPLACPAAAAAGRAAESCASHLANPSLASSQAVELRDRIALGPPLEALPGEPCLALAATRQAEAAAAASASAAACGPACWFGVALVALAFAAALAVFFALSTERFRPVAWFLGGGAIGAIPPRERGEEEEGEGEGAGEGEGWSGRAARDRRTLV